MESKPILAASENVYVRLLIDDGNQFDLEMASDSPLLHDLLQVLVNRSHHQPGGKLFKIPIDEGQSSFCFSSESLVAIATDTPIEIPEKLADQHPPTPTKESHSSKIIESGFVQIDNFLDSTENQSLIDYVLAHESEYRTPGNERSNKTFIPLAPPFLRGAGGGSLAESFAPWRTLLLDRTISALPQVLNQLEIPGFPLPRIEAVEFPELNHPYKVAGDNSTPETNLRVLNFIYYFSRKSNPQAHGSLKIYDSELIDNHCRSAESFKTVAPMNNRMIFFFSSYSHEVLPMTPGLAWRDCCFKFNGWLRRPDA